MKCFKSNNEDLDSRYEFSLDDVGLPAVKATMLEEYGPHGRIMHAAARRTILQTTRRVRVRSDHYFQRYAMDEFEWQKRDADYVIIDETKT